jgi:hypothetical protein
MSADGDADKGGTDDVGPVEFLLFGFEGNRFDGTILPELAELADRGLIRVIDLAIVSKDADGEVTILEMQELPGDVAEAMIAIAGDVQGLLSEADLLEVAESLPANSTTAALLYESRVFLPFAQAVRRASGQLLMSERIPNEIVENARATLLVAAELIEGERA